MHPFSLFNHGKKDIEFLSVNAGFFKKVQKLLEREQGQGRWDKRNQQDISRLENIFRKQGDIWRAIKKNRVILLDQRFENGADSFGGFLAIIQGQVQIPIGKVGREEVEIRIIGTPDIFQNSLAALKKFVGIEFFGRFDPKIIARRTLWIHITEQGFVP